MPPLSLVGQCWGGSGVADTPARAVGSELGKATAGEGSARGHTGNCWKAQPGHTKLAWCTLFPQPAQAGASRTPPGTPPPLLPLALCFLKAAGKPGTLLPISQSSSKLLTEINCFHTSSPLRFSFALRRTMGSIFRQTPVLTMPAAF